MCRAPSKALLRTCRRVMRYNAASQDVQQARLLVAGAGGAAAGREEQLMESLTALDKMVRGLCAKLEQPRPAAPVSKARRRRHGAGVRQQQKALEMKLADLCLAIAALEARGGDQGRRPGEAGVLRGCAGLVILALGTAAGCVAAEEGFSWANAAGCHLQAPAARGLTAWDSFTALFPVTPPVPAPDFRTLPSTLQHIVPSAPAPPAKARHARPPPPAGTTRPASHFGLAPWLTPHPAPASLTPNAIGHAPPPHGSTTSQLDHLGRSDQMSDSCVNVTTGSNASEEFFASQHHEWIRLEGFDPKSPQKRV
eukprot:TRINITY_DN3066_c1_g1_i1.p1 TRINITY_DN3066_c1_g1~~TRINITY_DN3066_c1_g1_i1.p1  ORF type:complete len:310 (+),score=80.27 TRINITY_DN3066_c1_g1_i1:62-991(+)